MEVIMRTSAFTKDPNRFVNVTCLWLGLHPLFLLSGVIIKVFSLLLNWVEFKVKKWNKVKKIIKAFTELNIGQLHMIEDNTKSWETTSGTIV